LATTDDARVHCAVLKIRVVSVPVTHRAYGKTGPAEDDHRAAVPSGPNSVLGPCAPRVQASRAARVRPY
jgi:hypothetical protein